MTTQTVADLIRQMLMMTFWLGLPLLMVGFVVGVFISLLQIVTSMQDPAFTTIPRLAAFLGALLLFLPWMLTRLTAFTIDLLGDLGRYAR